MMSTTCNEPEGEIMNDIALNIRDYSTELKLGEDGIWYSNKKSRIAYPAEAIGPCFEVEDNSFWFQHRNRCILAAVTNFPPEENGPIFDIGGGNGAVSKALSGAGFSVALVEPGSEGARNAKIRGIKNVICSTLEDAKFKSESFSAVGLFDVLEHIENRSGFLKTINEVLIRNGKLYLTVPAYKFLWSSDDEIAGHYTRYTLTELKEDLSNSGFKIEYGTYFFRWLPLPISVFRTIPYKLGIGSRIAGENIKEDHSIRNNLLRNLVDISLRGEIVNINRKSSMKVGGSCLVVATKLT
jgi:2-polyprenyl-3-methyl-5-hydroxy-6-metoxy-1,4-benzoquinol methylase